MCLRPHPPCTNYRNLAGGVLRAFFRKFAKLLMRDQRVFGDKNRIARSIKLGNLHVLQEPIVVVAVAAQHYL